MRSDTAAGAERHLRPDDGVRADLDVAVEIGTL
jgi:hypothetical protein